MINQVKRKNVKIGLEKNNIIHKFVLKKTDKF